MQMFTTTGSIEYGDAVKCSAADQVSTVEPLWKGQGCLTKVVRFDPFSCTILYKSCLFYPSWQATSFERPPSWVAFLEGFHCIIPYKLYCISDTWWAAAHFTASPVLQKLTKWLVTVDNQIHNKQMVCFGWDPLRFFESQTVKSDSVPTVWS